MNAPYLERLQAALAELSRARDELARAATVAAETRFELQVKEAHLIVSGLEGKNEAERKANLFLQTSEEQQAQSAAEIGLKHAQRDYDIAEAAFTTLRYELRAQELAVKSLELRAAAG